MARYVRAVMREKLEACDGQGRWLRRVYAHDPGTSDLAEFIDALRDESNRLVDSRDWTSWWAGIDFELLVLVLLFQAQEPVIRDRPGVRVYQGDLEVHRNYPPERWLSLSAQDAATELRSMIEELVKKRRLPRPPAWPSALERDVSEARQFVDREPARTGKAGNLHDFQESTAEASTRLLRESDEPLYARLRYLLLERGIDVSRAALADFFPDDTNMEFGIVVTADRRVIEFDLHYGTGDLNRKIATASITDWRDRTDWGESTLHNPNIEDAIRLLDRM